MIRTLTKNWYLLASCGFLNAITSVIYLVMYEADPGSIPLPGWHAEVMLLGSLLVAAGVCAIATAVWRPEKDILWLLVLHGLALSAYGLLPVLWKGPLSFRLFANLVVVMAMTFAAIAFRAAQSMRSHLHAADQWLLNVAGGSSVCFVLAFLALANGWIQLERRPVHPSLFLWFCLFFAFNATCLVGLALRMRHLRYKRVTPMPLRPVVT